MKTLLGRFTRDVAGSAAIEYVLLGSLVAIAIIVGATALGGSMNGTFQNATDTYQAGLGAGGGEAGE
ncbi:MAG: Flp family type IVb pilin [Bauldia sp.]|nr:Flp family type IVb pilin [Bauldia sp.]